MVMTCRKCGKNSPGVRMYNHKTKKMGAACKRCLDVRFFIIMRLAAIDISGIEEEINGNV